MSDRAAAGRITIVHAADAHIDSPLRGLARLGDDALAKTLRLATRHAFENLIELSIERRADALVLAGDTYDGDARDYGTARFLADQLARLDAAGIPVVMLTGNHDADSVITKSLVLPDNVRTLPSDHPGSVHLPGVAFHGQGFATRAELRNLARTYPQPVAGMVNVGILHTSVAGYDEHDTYAPCSVDDLCARGYEYFALGHVHQRQVLCEGPTTAAFSGNLQGRHVKETGPKGALVVTLAPGARAELEFVELDVARWEHPRLDVSSAASLREVLALVSDELTRLRRAADGRPVVARVTLLGTTAAAPELADQQKLMEDVDAVARRLDVALESVRNRTRAPQEAVGVPVDAELLAEARAAFDPAQVLGKLHAQTDGILRQLGLFEPPDPGLVDEAHESLLARLAGGAR